MEKLFSQDSTWEMRTATVEIRGNRWVRLSAWPSLLRLVELQDMPCSIKIDDVAVDDHLVFAGIVRNAVHIFNGVAVGSQLPDDRVDIYHERLEDVWPGRGCFYRDS